VGVQAVCSQARRPAVRSPVSSKQATFAAVIRSAITGRILSMIGLAARLTQPDTVAAATGRPNSSDKA
jgi:hypothetical protein